MPRTVRTAKGELVDFDAIIIKQQIAEAPMNIEVARRKNFIDAKEGKGRGPRTPQVQPQPLVEAAAPVAAAPVEENFETEAAPLAKLPPVAEPVPNLPNRKK